MSTPIADQLRAYFDDLDRQQGAIDIDALRRSVEDREITIELSSDEALPQYGPTAGLHWPILIFAAAVALVVGVLVVFDRDDSELEVPAAPPATVPSKTSVDTFSTELVVQPLDPIECEPEGCPWSPELTAQRLDPAFACSSSTPASCLAVSPEGTLVAFDAGAKTLTWYEDEPRVVSLTFEGCCPGAGLQAIGPHDIAYLAIGHRPSYFVAVAPSGAQIGRVDTPNGAPFLYPTATGLGRTAAGRSKELWVPWVDLDGNPITDSRTYPTAKVTGAGIEVRLGEREWLIAGGERFDDTELLTYPRSDGGVVVIVLFLVDGAITDRQVLELSTDGTTGRYFVDDWPRVMPDGSLIVKHNRELVRLTPPA